MTCDLTLKSCPNPWCGRAFEPNARRQMASTRWYVACEDCGLDGPTAPTEAEAIAAWNNRPVLPASGDLKELERRNG